MNTHHMKVRLGGFLATANSAGLWSWIDRITKVIVLLGIPMFFVQEHIKSEQDRASNTLDFVKRFGEAELVSQRMALLKPWLQYDVSSIEAAKIPKETLSDLVLKMIEVSEDERQGDLRSAIFRIVDFYETLGICIEIGRCNAQIATSYFMDYAHRFSCLYRPYIEELRSKQLITSFGMRLEGFAQRKGPCSNV